MNEEILKPYIRAVTDEDRKNLPRFSHSKLECFENCQFNYNKKYNEKKYSSDTSIALQSGTLAHLLLELKCKQLVAGKSVDYEHLNKIMFNGYDEVTDKTKEHIAGLDEIKKTYWETYSDPDSEGRTYEDKWKIFDGVLRTEMETDKWQPVLFEHPFEFVWNDKIIISGFIDRIDKYDKNRYRVVDYKSSKKPYDEKKIKTAQQMCIYACAILNEFDILPEQFLYRFVFIDQSQYANTKGWEKRFIKKMDKILGQLDECESSKIYTPKPSPLCYYCNYCQQNPNAYEYEHECEYYSLWTPTNKTFEKNKEFDPSKETCGKNYVNRKIIF